jgi:hypothetical protein
MRSQGGPATLPSPRCFRRPMRAALGLVVCLALLVAAAPASAARNLITGFDDAVYHSTDATQRDAALQTTVDEGAGVVRIDVSWAAIAGPTEPANPTDPADPSYNFTQLDSSVTAAHAHGLDVLLTVYRAPAWAEGPNRPPVSDEVSPAGSWRPNANAYGKFGQALATRYSGKYPNPDGSGDIPAVTHFEAWNEENLWVYIAPQYAHGKETAVEIYRSLLNAFYDGVHKGNPKAQVLLGGNAPYGDPPGGIRTRPISFLKQLFCLTENLQPLSCPDPAKFDILGVHPINLSGGPTRSAVSDDDASSADVPNIVAVLRKAEDAGTVDGGHHSLWATEFWWESYPDSGAKGIPGLAKHGLWIEQAMYLFWKAGVKVAINLQLTDTPAGSEDELNTTFQAGIFLADGTPKPAATSFRFPFVLDRESKSKVFVWGKSPEKGKLAIERKQGSGWKQVDSVNAKANNVFTTTLKAHGKGKYRATVGDQTSLVWTLRK